MQILGLKWVYCTHNPISHPVLLDVACVTWWKNEPRSLSKGDWYEPLNPPKSTPWCCVLGAGQWSRGRSDSSVIDQCSKWLAWTCTTSPGSSKEGKKVYKVSGGKFHIWEILFKVLKFISPQDVACSPKPATGARTSRSGRVVRAPDRYRNNWGRL